MELKEVQEFIKTNSEKEEVQNYIKGFITPDGVKSFLDTEEGMKLIQPKLDQHFTKSLETWKTNNLQKFADEYANKVIAEKYPTETEEQKRLRKLEQDLAAETTKRQQAEMMNSALAEATARGLPTEIIKFLIGNDIESTKANLQLFEQVYKGDLDKRIQGKLKQFGRQPEKGGEDEAGLLTAEDVRKMSLDEVRKNSDKIHKSMTKW